MLPHDIIRSLTRNELTVLYWKARGLQYKQIATRYGKTVQWVQAHMSRVYQKFGLDNPNLHHTDRWDILQNQAGKIVLDMIGLETHKLKDWPIHGFKTFALEGGKPEGSAAIEEGGIEEAREEKIEEAVGETPPDPNIMALVLLDEHEEEDKRQQGEAENQHRAEEKRKRQTEPIFVPTKRPALPGHQETRPRPPWRAIGLLALLLAAVGGGAYWLGQKTSPPSPTALPQPSAPLASPIPAVSPTAFAVATEAPSNTPQPPTQTAVPPTPTLAPTNTAILVPLQAFTDDFSQGPSPEWNVLNGQWLTANGRYTTLADFNQYAWLWSILEGPTWGNYRVKVDYKMNYPYAADQGELAVAVRMSGNQVLAFTINTLMYGGWAFVGAQDDDIQYVAGEVKEGIPTAGTLQLEAVGDNFTARINGQVVQTLNLSGFETGGVGLGINCHNDIGECPTFDNFSLDPIQ